MIAVIGNTYPVKEQLKALGGKWDASEKLWFVPDDKIDEANRIVNNQQQSTSTKKKSAKHTKKK